MSDKDIERDDIEQVVHEIMFHIVTLLNQYGYHDVRAGNLMRLLGTPEEDCVPFDDKIMFVDGEYLDMRDVIPGEIDIDSDSTLH